MSNDKGNVFERLWKLQTMVNKMVLDGKRDPYKVCSVLQDIVNEDDDIICVDRFIRSVRLIRRLTQDVYLNAVAEVVHSELETVGPAEYTLERTSFWFHPQQQEESNRLEGVVIYKHLVETGIIKKCVGLHDLLAILEKGAGFFRKHFQGKYVFGWKSVVRNRNDHNDDLRVPYLFQDGSGFGLGWKFLCHAWDGSDPALYFKDLYVA